MKRIVLLFLFISSTQAHADVKVYAPKDPDSTSAEVELLLRSLVPENLTPKEKSKLNAFIDNYSQYAVRLSKRDLFFIAKTESAKLLLASRPETSSILKNYDSKKILDLENNTDWPAYLPWAQFVYRSLLRDAKALVSDPRFLSLWVANTPANIEGLALLRKRVELVLSWVDYFAYTAIVGINAEMEAMAIKALGRIENATWILYNTTLPKVEDTSTAKSLLFELIEIKDSPKAKTAQQILDSALDPLVETSVPKLPAPVNDWQPNEIPNKPFAGQNIIKEKDPFYSAPVILPKPTNDWILSL
tara:strand:- start:7 stop:915 length:909 start_codon:yes stop_codon:yes gene_type:complete